MEMPDTHPIESDTQTAKLDNLSPSSSVSSDNSSIPSTKPQHRRFLSLDNIEATSTRILTRIRSRSPLPRSHSPSADGKRRCSPPPLQPASAQSSSTSPASPLSPSSIGRVYSPPEMSPTSSHHAHRSTLGHKHGSDASTSTIDSSERSRSDSYKRYSGTINHYGRHSNDWLFGGFSMRDTLRDGIEKLKGHGEREG